MIGEAESPCVICGDHWRTRLDGAEQPLIGVRHTAGGTSPSSRARYLAPDETTWRNTLGFDPHRARVVPTGLPDVRVRITSRSGPDGPFQVVVIVDDLGRLSFSWDDDRDGALVVDASYCDVMEWLHGGLRLGVLLAAGLARGDDIPLLSALTYQFSSHEMDRAARSQRDWAYERLVLLASRQAAWRRDPEDSLTLS